MNAAKAIELLKLDIENPGQVAIEDIHEAEQLGIEALEVCKNRMDRYPPYNRIFLLGETKE